LIDGQQRVMPLSREMSDDEGIEVLFNAESEQFSLANVATRFITSDVNRAISHSGPEVYLSEIKPVLLQLPVRKPFSHKFIERLSEEIPAGGEERISLANPP
jgi:hypothetical protein